MHPLVFVTMHWRSLSEAPEIQLAKKVLEEDEDDYNDYDDDYQ